MVPGACMDLQMGETPAGAAWQPAPHFESRACVYGDLGSHSLCIHGTLNLVVWQEDKMYKGRTGVKDDMNKAHGTPYRQHQARAA